MRKKVDQRIQILIENIIKLRQRGFFIILGDRGKDQVVNLFHLLHKQQLNAKPKILWCYKKDLGFTTHKKKRIKEIQSLQKKGLYDQDIDDPFELFISSTEIRYTYYKDTHKILGNTFNMLILQDFQALTPNILCRTIETVEGGGLVVILLNTMTGLKQLHSISMDVHSRFRTEQFQDVQPRFNERMIISFSQCQNCIVMDDELNILPISSLINDIKAESSEFSMDSQIHLELSKLQDELKSNALVGPLVGLARTLDQAKAIMGMLDAVQEKQMRSTISLTAGRGRGKSAAIGIAMAGSVASGFSNIFVTAPSPENLNSLFQFLIEGLEALGYKENMHFDIIQSTNPDFNNAIIRINVFKTHRQIIQYILPVDYQRIGQADLLIIDEAAAIPLTYVKKLLGPYPVFLSSTINGYEGTGRSLSLKLIQQLKDGARILKEITLEDPIRYAANDPIEKWLNKLLLLEATQVVPLKQSIPHPNDCELYLINRDTLFSCKKMTEIFLFNLMSLFISSHYKNSPNDLQLLSDAPAHAIFVLINKIPKNDGDSKKVEIPDILCAVQIAFEGKISYESVMSKNQRSAKPSGDMIPWIVSEQFQDAKFPQLSGARIVRVATHPAAQRMGYGSKAMELLSKFFEGQLINLGENTETLTPFMEASSGYQNKNTEQKQKLMPLLKHLTEIEIVKLDYLGVSFGLSKQLFRFWKKNNFLPIYIRQTQNELTTEHSTLMIKSCNQNNSEWVEGFNSDFQKRFINLLSFEFRELELYQCLSIIDPQLNTNEQKNFEEVEFQDDKIESQDNKYIITKNQLEHFIDSYDLKRLQAYAKNIIDFHMIMDLMPTISKLFFMNKMKGIRMSHSQCAIQLGLGLQHKTVDQVSQELNIPTSQVLALFNKAIRKFYNYFNSVYEKDIQDQMDQVSNKNKQNNQMDPLKKEVRDEMQIEGENFVKSLEKKYLEQDKNVNKKRKAGKYNFEMNDIDDSKINMALKQQEVGSDNIPDKIIIERDAKIAINEQYQNKQKFNKKIKK